MIRFQTHHVNEVQNVLNLFLFPTRNYRNSALDVRVQLCDGQNEITMRTSATKRVYYNCNLC